MFKFSGQEIRDLLTSALIMAFVVAYPFAGMTTVMEMAIQMAVATLVLGTAFIFHELAHKFTAQSYGCWSEFRMWKEGLFLAMMLRLFNMPLFIAPGATYFSPFIAGIATLQLSREQHAKISLAGPLTNIALAFMFFALRPILGGVSLLAIQVNLALAFFNMLPVGPLDGRKVAGWNFWIWGGFITAITVLQYFLLAF